MTEDAESRIPNRSDAALRWVWGADYEALAAILPMPVAPSKKAAMAMASIVIHAWYEAHGLDRPISYSRAKTWYANRDRYGPGSAYGYSTVVGAVDALVDVGILGQHYKAPAGCRSAGRQSHFCAGQALRSIANLPHHLPSPMRFDSGAVVRLRDAEGCPIALPKTRAIDRMCRVMEAINEGLSRFTLAMGPDADAEFNKDANVLRFPSRSNSTRDGQAPGAPRLADGRFVGAVVAPDRLALHRVFNRSMDLGGRLYGGWWQGVPSSERRHLLIDDGPVAEVDYHHLHPRLLYAYAGHRLHGDAYTIKGCETERSLVKKAFNTMINASSWAEARGAIASALGGDVVSAQRLMRTVARHHAQIRRLFCSGLGLRLQRIDSDIAIAVVTELTVRRGLPCYPVHDSFIVPASTRETLIAVMDNCLEEGLAIAASDGRQFRLESIDSSKNDLHMKGRAA